VAAKAMVNDAAVWLVRVIVEELLVVPTVQVPKVTLVGEKLNGRIAVPVASRTSGLTAVLFANAIAPVIVPLVEGLNVTVNVHDPPEAKVVTQPEAV
jgi:hypothetical protein